MKTVFLAGSRKFFREIEEVKYLLEKEGIHVLKGRDSKEDEEALYMFQRIDQSDIIYVVSIGGYVGRTAAEEIDYAFGKGKEIFSSEHVSDNFRHSIQKTISPAELADYIKRN